MPGMRVSLVARFMTHPPIDFGTRRPAVHRHRLGLHRPQTVYHQPRRARHLLPTIGALRAQTHGFRFPSVTRLSGVPVRRTTSLFGPSRARRA